ncbi:OmpP1/FadL family transporter [Bacteroidota bacterium]
MKSVYFTYIFLILLFQNITAQNTDILTKFSRGKYASMGGSGLGIVRGISSIDFNPAGLKDIQTKSFSVSSNFKYYSYDSFIHNSGAGTITSLWNSKVLNFESISAFLPISNSISIGAGLYQKLSPFTSNVRRFTTWSIMFSQETAGSIYAIAVAGGYKISSNFSIGLTLYKYFGNTSSKIIGDNHGDDSDKYASLKNSYSGYGFRFGSQFELGNIAAGIIIEIPTELDVKTTSSISQDNLYQYLLPQYDETVFKLPLIFGIGLTYTQKNSFILSLEVESQKYSDNNVQFNLFEYGSNPEWRNLILVRGGVEFYPFSNSLIPIRFGYAYIPQLYSSNNSIGTGQIITGYSNTDQNVIHTFSTGTTLNYRSFEINIGLQYSFYNWHRNLDTYINIYEDYSGKTITLLTQIIFQF